MSSTLGSASTASSVAGADLSTARRTTTPEVLVLLHSLVEQRLECPQCMLATESGVAAYCKILKRIDDLWKLVHQGLVRHLLILTYP